MSTAEIGRLWTDGEDLSKNGMVHEALMQFQRAKALLLIESKTIQDGIASGKITRIPQILGEIMEKLTDSIDKNANFLHKNPLITLGVRKEYSHKEVKKAYKRYALKYHPDKNRDCDTSCIFAAIQSSYERLMSLPPPSSDTTTHSTSTSDTTAHSSSGTNKQPSSASHSKGASSASSVPLYSRQQSSSDSSHVHARPPSGNKTSRATFSENSDGITNLSTEDLRNSLKKLGFERLERATREELIKKYLAVRTHFNTKKNPQGSSQSDTSDSRSSHQREHGKRNKDKEDDLWSSESEERQNKRDDDPILSDMLREEMRSERYKEWQKKSGNRSGNVSGGGGGGVQKEAGRANGKQESSSSSSAKATSRVPKKDDPLQRYREWQRKNSSEKSGESAPKTKDQSNTNNDTNVHTKQPKKYAENYNYNYSASDAPVDSKPLSTSGLPKGHQTDSNPSRHKSADENRRNRIRQMTEELPRLSILELRKMMLVSGISTLGCLEKEDLLRNIFEHFGIDPKAAQIQRNLYEGYQDSNQSSNIASKMSSQFCGPFPSTAVPDVRHSPPNDAVKHTPLPCTDAGHESQPANKIFDSSCKFEKADCSAKIDAKAPVGHGIWTREKLQEMERKLKGAGRSQQPKAMRPTTTESQQNSKKVSRMASAQVAQEDFMPQSRYMSHDVDPAWQGFVDQFDIKSGVLDDSKSKNKSVSNSRKDNGKDAVADDDDDDDDEDEDDDMDMKGKEPVASEWKSISSRSLKVTSEEKGSSHSLGEGEGEEVVLPSGGFYASDDDDIAMLNEFDSLMDILKVDSNDSNDSNVDDDDDDDDEADKEEREGSSEVDSDDSLSLFMNPSLSPSKIKELRMKRLNARGFIERSVKPLEDETTSLSKELSAAAALGHKENILLSPSVQVGKSLLSDSEDSFSDEEELLTYKSPVKSTGLMSATAWRDNGRI